MSKKTRIKIPLIAITTRAEAEDAMSAIAQADAKRRGLEAAMDAKVHAIHEASAPALAECDTEIKRQSQALQVWAEANPQEFGKKKSLTFLSGTLGFRTGGPKLALLNKAWNWEKVLEQVQRCLPNFIRDKPEIDKEAILGQRDEEAIKAVLPRCGLKVTQDEGFFIEPNQTEAEARGAA